uniref:CeoA n=1 Tax=Burkholderia cepacia TaxID=292 RepID=O06470_BURCE|nr:CeoA [Burkholderia cepacia]
MAILRTSRSRIATAAIVTLAVVGLGTFGAMRVSANAPEKAAAPLPEVDVATVVPQTVTDWQSYSGRLEAVEKVDVRPQVSGTIVAVNFKDGALVKKGDVLFVIDPRPYQAEVDRAAAQLAAAQARNGYAQTDWQRAQRLIGDNAIAKRDYDEKQNAAREAKREPEGRRSRAGNGAHQSRLYAHHRAGVGPRVARGNHARQRRVGRRVGRAADDAGIGVADLRVVRRRRADLPAIHQRRAQRPQGAGRARPRERNRLLAQRRDRFGRQPARHVVRHDPRARPLRQRGRHPGPGPLRTREGGRQRAARGAARRRRGDQHRPGQEVRVRRRPAGPRVVSRSAARDAARQPARDRERAVGRRPRGRERHAARASGRAGEAAHGPDDGRRCAVRAVASTAKPAAPAKADS